MKNNHFFQLTFGLESLNYFSISLVIVVTMTAAKYTDACEPNVTELMSKKYGFDVCHNPHGKLGILNMKSTESIQSN